MQHSPQNLPAWDEEQLRVILDPRDSWQLVEAGPGAGKTAVACQRIAFLIDDGVPPSRILLISFTRTAVAEIRNRIVSYSAAGERARGVRISTLDSYAWSLRVGADDERLSTKLQGDSFDLNIEAATEQLNSRQPVLLEFMQSLGHLIVDEAQDIMSLRADLVLAMLKSIALDCGVTILSDPAQAIYGFSSDSDRRNERPSSLLDRLAQESPRPFSHRRLLAIYRTKDVKLTELYTRAREELYCAEPAESTVRRVQKSIREAASSSLENAGFENIAEVLQTLNSESALVLFRRRVDVLLASSYCSNADISHRIRMSDLPTVVQPWIGWLFFEETRATLGAAEFERIWSQRLAECAAPMVGMKPQECWLSLQRVAAGRAANTLDLEHLRNVLARPRPPAELCTPDFGEAGPILGTIHASKGREADTVLLFLSDAIRSRGVEDESAEAMHREEGRVYYVGATRARKILLVADGNSRPASYLESGRVYRATSSTKAQFEVGRRDDVSPTAHLKWDNALEVQRLLATLVGQTVSARASALEEFGYRRRLSIQVPHGEVSQVVDIGELSESFDFDVKRLWGRIDKEQRLRPSPSLSHLYMTAVSTVGLGEAEKEAVAYPFNKSRIGLMPMIKGFPLLCFLNRRYRGIR